jgi:2'-5' RNA ligase
VTAAGTVGGRESLRLFCGLPLPDDTVGRIVAWQAANLSAGRIVPPENLHVTLAFLGSRPAGDVETVVAALREAALGVGPPELTVRTYRETRSVGMLVLDDPSGRAAALAERLHERLEQLGVYEREQRGWLAHVTVLRFRRPPRLDPPAPDLGAFEAVRAALYHSVLRPGGAQYVVLESVALGG